VSDGLLHTLQRADDSLRIGVEQGFVAAWTRARAAGFEVACEIVDEGWTASHDQNSPMKVRRTCRERETISRGALALNRKLDARNSRAKLRTGSEGQRLSD
jgi:hypothetical protein